MKTSLKLERLISVCPGKNHGWYASEIGPVRKPLQGEYIEAGMMTGGEDAGPGVVVAQEKFEPPIVKRATRWQRFVMWWKKLWI